MIDTNTTQSDWQEFWESEDIVINMDGGVGGSWEVKSTTDNDNLSPYIRAVLGLEPYPPSFKRESPLTE